MSSHLADRMRKKKEIQEEVLKILTQLSGKDAKEEDIFYIHGLLFALGYDIAKANSFIFSNVPLAGKVKWE